MLDIKAYFKVAGRNRDLDFWLLDLKLIKIDVNIGENLGLTGGASPFLRVGRLL